MAFRIRPTCKRKKILIDLSSNKQEKISVEIMEVTKPKTILKQKCSE